MQGDPGRRGDEISGRNKQVLHKRRGCKKFGNARKKSTLQLKKRVSRENDESTA